LRAVCGNTPQIAHLASSRHVMYSLEQVRSPERTSGQSFW
jgi:hypothetical protein